MPVKIKVSVEALRIAVLVFFALSVAATVWSYTAMHNHILHIAHIALITLTFLLIALYLRKSARIASLSAFRELRLRLTVDPGAVLIQHLREGAPVCNACTGALAKKGIYTGSANSLRILANLQTVAVAGSVEAREGYAATISTLAEMGVELSDDIGSCPIKIKLGPFDAGNDAEYDFVITQDKIAHLLAAIYISRVFVRFTLYSRVFAAVFIAAAAALSAFGYFTYAGAAIALLAASGVIMIRQIEKKTTRMTFKSVLRYRPPQRGVR